MSSTELKVIHLLGNVYQVTEFYIEDGEYEDAGTLYQGSIADCEAFIRLKNNDLLL